MRFKYATWNVFIYELKFPKPFGFTIPPTVCFHTMRSKTGLILRVCLLLQECCCPRVQFEIKNQKIRQ